MFSAVRRRAAIVMRFVLADARTRKEAQLLRDSGLFDRDFYLRSNPRLRRLFCLAPERHYLLFGEPMGLCPNPAFSPRAYLHNNPDVTTGRALVHFIKKGRAEGRTAYDTAPVGDLDLPLITPRAQASPARVAVVLHLFYHDLWDAFRTALAQQDFAFDLFVTATGTPEDIAPLRGRIMADFPHARIWAMPNHGRDIFPFVYLLASGVLAPYRAVCKLHGKRSPHRADGDTWRNALVAGVMGAPAQTAARLERFLADPALGLWVADGQIVQGDDWWGMNRARATALLTKAGLTAPPHPLRFPAGSVYWLKPPVLDALSGLALTAQDFEREQQLVDGTTAHAIERLMGHLTTHADLEMCPAQSLDVSPHLCVIRAGTF